MVDISNRHCNVNLFHKRLNYVRSSDILINVNMNQIYKEDYINSFTKIKDSFDIEIIECKEDLENQLINMLMALEKWENNTLGLL